MNLDRASENHFTPKFPGGEIGTHDDDELPAALLLGTAALELWDSADDASDAENDEEEDTATTPDEEAGAEDDGNSADDAAVSVDDDTTGPSDDDDNDADDDGDRDEEATVSVDEDNAFSVDEDKALSVDEDNAIDEETVCPLLGALVAVDVEPGIIALLLTVKLVATEDELGARLPDEDDEVLPPSWVPGEHAAARIVTTREERREIICVCGYGKRGTAVNVDDERPRIRRFDRRSKAAERDPSQTRRSNLRVIVLTRSLPTTSGARRARGCLRAAGRAESTHRTACSPA